MLLDLVRLGHVGRRIDRLDAELGLEASPFLLDVVRLAEAVDQYICALLCERPGNGQPDAAGRAGHNGGFGAKRH